MMAADNLGSFLHFCPIYDHRFSLLSVSYAASYGSLARFKDIQRLHVVGDYTILGAGGDMSDFQHIQHTLDSLMSVASARLATRALMKVFTGSKNSQ